MTYPLLLDHEGIQRRQSHQDRHAGADTDAQAKLPLVFLFLVRLLNRRL